MVYLLAHGDYSSTTNYRTKIVTIFRGIFIFSVAQLLYSEPGRLIVEVSRPHGDVLHSVRLLRTRDWPVAETST